MLIRSTTIASTHVGVDCSHVKRRVEVEDRPSHHVEPSARDVQLVGMGAGDLDVRGVDAGVLQHSGDYRCQYPIGQRAQVLTSYQYYSDGALNTHFQRSVRGGCVGGLTQTRATDHKNGKGEFHACLLERHDSDNITVQL